jgi:alpha-L-arabinofuranosidase
MWCEAAGADGVVGINKWEDPAEIKNMIEYAKGSVTTEYGAMRARDGHPDPLPLKYIEIANSAGRTASSIKQYFSLWKNLATEIWKADPNIVIMAGGILRQADNFKPGEPNNEIYNIYRDFLLWVKAQGKEAQYAQENHYSAAFSDDNTIQTQWGIIMQKYLASDIGFKLKLYPMEENGGNHNFQRGLYHAYLQNHFNRWGDRVNGSATANLFEPAQGVPIWSQGRIFWDSYRFWNQTSGHVDQMYTKEWLPWVLDVKEEETIDSLDVLVKESDDGKVVSMYVVNYGLQPKTREINLSNFIPNMDALVTQLGPYPLTARNSGENPNYITPKNEPKKIWGSQFKHQFPGHSFTVIRMERK